MIVFYKTSHTRDKYANTFKTIKVSRRKNTKKVIKKITKNNKDFLRALGFKI